jgi:hypothetical protein
VYCILSEEHAVEGIRGIGWNRPNHVGRKGEGKGVRRGYTESGRG